MFDLNLRDSRPIYEQLKDRLRFHCCNICSYSICTKFMD